MIKKNPGVDPTDDPLNARLERTADRCTLTHGFQNALQLIKFVVGSHFFIARIIAEELPDCIMDAKGLVKAAGLAFLDPGYACRGSCHLVPDKEVVRGSHARCGRTQILFGCVEVEGASLLTTLLLPDALQGESLLPRKVVSSIDSLIDVVTLEGC